MTEPWALLKEFRRRQSALLDVTESAEFDAELLRFRGGFVDEHRFAAFVAINFLIESKQALERIHVWSLVSGSEPLRIVAQGSYPDVKRLVRRLIKAGIEHTVEDDESIRKLLSLTPRKQVAEIRRMAAASNTPEAT